MHTHSNRLVVIINAKWKRQKIRFCCVFPLSYLSRRNKMVEYAFFSMLLCSLFCIHEYVSISIHGQSRERTLRYRKCANDFCVCPSPDAPQISSVGHIQHANEEPKFNCNILLVNFKLNDSRLISATKRWPMLDMPHACRCNCFEPRDVELETKRSRPEQLFLIKVGKAFRCFESRPHKIFTRIFLDEPTGCCRSMFFIFS